MIKNVHHIGIAVQELTDGIALYQYLFGLQAEIVEPPPGSTLTFAIIRLPGCEIELFAPAADATPITRFLNERGPGLHHIAFSVDDIAGAMATVSERGAPPLSPPRPGIENTQTCFFHPRETMGVLYEFVATSTEH